MKFYKRRRDRNGEAPGEDSFLDIVANLVGVLIILVVVVGANAGSQIHENAIGEVDQQELQDLEEKYQAAARHARSLESDNRQLGNKILYEQRLSQMRQYCHEKSFQIQQHYNCPRKSASQSQRISKLR